MDCTKSNATTSPFGRCAVGTRPVAAAPKPAAVKPSAPAPVNATTPVKPVTSTEVAAVASPTAGYVKCAEFNQLCRIGESSLLIWGKGTRFSTGTVVDKSVWCNGSLGSDFADNRGTACWIKPVGIAKDTSGSSMEPPALPVAVPALPALPAVLPVGDLGSPVFKVAPTYERPAESDIGAFRTACAFAKMAPIDPIVFPGTVGKSHLHTFFGNVAVNENSTTDSLLAFGNSTCRGGIANRSGYWVPSMIDTATGQPVVPDGINVYYKSGAFAGDKLSRGVPQGLRMVAGNPAATGPRTENDVFAYRFKCIGGPNDENDKYGSSIPNCDLGASVWQEIFFPQCWDGVNLDSPDHKSHMSYPVAVPDPSSTRGWQMAACPPSHPVILPEISFNVMYTAKTRDAALKWRLVSDSYDTTKPGGYSSHGDWFNGWRHDISEAWFKNCLVAKKDCHSHLLGDGRMTY
ncbi:MAG: DUF1996 domain-containing protein [Pseudomonadota bacterium]